MTIDEVSKSIGRIVTIESYHAEIGSEISLARFKEILAAAFTFADLNAEITKEMITNKVNSYFSTPNANSAPLLDLSPQDSDKKNKEEKGRKSIGL